MKIEKNIYQLCFDKTMQDYDIFLNMTKKKEFENQNKPSFAK